MFKPKYIITSEILKNLVRTAEAKAMLENAYLVPSRQHRHEKDAGHPGSEVPRGNGRTRPR